MKDARSRIAALNDRCRHGLDPRARILVTAACLAEFAGDRAAGEILAQAELMAAVRRYDFRPVDGAERDRGEFVLKERTVRFRIDYYDPSLEWGSEDPADAAATVRVMTIMLPSDD